MHGYQEIRATLCCLAPHHGVVLKSEYKLVEILILVFKTSTKRKCITKLGYFRSISGNKNISKLHNKLAEPLNHGFSSHKVHDEQAHYCDLHVFYHNYFGLAYFINPN